MKKRIVLVCSLFLLLGCSSYVPKNEIEDIQTTENIDNIQTTNHEIDNETKSGEAAENLTFSDEKWWLSYNDENLNNLIDLALESNTDLKVATLNIEQASATISAAEASNFQMGLYADATYHGTSQAYTKSKAIPGPMGTTAVPKNAAAGNTAYTAGVGLKASYAFDFYGKYKNLTLQQEYMTEAAKFHSKLVELNITTNLVKLYASYIYLNKQGENLKQRLEVLNSMKEKIDIAISLGQGTEESRINIENKQYSLQRYINLNNLKIDTTKQTIYALATYKNRESVDIILKNSLNDNIMEQELIIPNNISSDVIINRPDVQYYLMMIKSQQAKLKALKSDFYPQVSIGGDIGYKGYGNDNSFRDFQSLMWSFGPKVYLPIFNMSGVKTNYKIAGLQVNTFIANYNNTINGAITDINTKLTTAKIEKLNAINYSDSFKNDEQTYKNSKFKFKVGTVSEYEYLNSRYSYLDSSLQREQQNFKLFSNQVDLINSLGGVYKSKEQLKKELETNQ